MTIRNQLNLIDGWSDVLKPLIESSYLAGLDYFLLDQYEDKSDTYPLKSLVTKPFELCEWDKLKVVILGNGVYSCGGNTGLAFGESSRYISFPHSEIKAIRGTVNKTMYNKISTDLSFDITLEDWADQGVLLLNVSSTVRKYAAGSHRAMWHQYTREVIKSINAHRTGVIYMLWGQFAQFFERYIDPNLNFILKARHPYSSKETLWECNNFVEASNILTGYNSIVW